MTVKDPDIFKLIERLGEHYQQNINNQHVRKAFLALSLSNTTWDLIDSLTDKGDYHKYQGYQFQELYDRILAAATFVYQVRKQILPNLKGLLSRASSADQVVLKLVINNFPTNLSIFADMINELYLKTTGLDRAEHIGGSPVYERNPELGQIGHFLVG